MSKIMDISKLYTNRSTEEDIKFKTQVYSYLRNDFFSKYISADDTVLDIAAGRCEFINTVCAKKKIALDINADVLKYANGDVTVVVGSATSITEVPDSSVDVVYVSNLFEHLSREDIVTTLHEIQRVLKRGGKVLTLHPNYRYCTKSFYSFFDHTTPLDDRSLCEALRLCGFEIVEARPKFLPYSVKFGIPRFPWMIRLYIRIPLLQQLFGSQMFVFARKP